MIVTGIAMAYKQSKKIVRANYDCIRLRLRRKNLRCLTETAREYDMMRQSSTVMRCIIEQDLSANS
jgi:hypothetical protein